MRQIATESMREYIKKQIQDTGKCEWHTALNGEEYCHFLNREQCPFNLMEPFATIIYGIPNRKIFYRCLL